MISFFTTRILDFLKSSEAIECDENNLDIYKYGIEITLSTILNILIILILSLIYGSFFTGIIFLLVFIPLRKFTGGYHADTYMKCNIVFAILYTSVFWLTKILYKYTDVHIIEAILAISFIVVYIFSPIENPHKPLDSDEKRKYRMLSIITYILFTAIAIAISHVFYYISVCMMITMLSIIVLMIIPVIQNHLWNNPKFF